jgi:hypothetical protein
MRRYIHHIVTLAVLTSLVGMLAWTNYVPGTMLAGWDDLHHEFNFPLALERIMQGVWRADQGLGAVAGHSHMSDLPRIIILWIISLIVPLQNVRFVFVIVSLYAGIMGMYCFVYSLLGKSAKQSPASYSIVALISSFVYVFNLGTVQQFILPFEMFMVQFAVLPWLILSAFWYLYKPKALPLLIFTIFVLLFSSTAYAATLWYVFFGIFFIWLIFTLLIHLIPSLPSSLSRAKSRESNLIHFALSVQTRHILILIIVFIVMNLYWLLPNIYFAKNHGEEVRTSKINTIFSPDMFEANKQFGNVKDALLLKSFLFDWQMYDYDSHSFPQIMESWRKHLSKPWGLATGYLITFMGIGGILLAIKRKDIQFIPYAVFLVIPFVLLLNGTWPISALYEQLSTISPIIKEALRTPFTKVSIPASFGLALFVGYFVLQLHRIGKALFRIGVVVSMASVLYFALPAFQGGYIHRLVQVKIPTAYFEMFSYFQTQPKHARVALLPIHTFWNWTHYTWGYQGAGFLQFGIPQPLLDRDYGRWTEQNEQYNREMSYALYSQNAEILAMTIQKFDIEYMVLDTSVFEPSLPTQHSLLNWISPIFIEETQLFDEPLRFGDGIFVYKRRNQRAGDVYLTQNLSTLDSQIHKNSPVDTIFSTQGAHISLANVDPKIDEVPDFVRTAKVIQTYHIDLPHMSPRWDFCADRKNKQSGRSNISEGIQYVSIDTNVCETFVFPDLPHDTSYILVFKSTNIVGRPLTFCVKNLLTGHCDLSEQLRYGADNTTEYYHLPRLWDYGQGYQVEVTNIARGRGKSANLLMSLEIWQVEDPIMGSQSQLHTVMPVDIRNENNYFREIRVDTSEVTGKEAILVLDQAYEDGWIGLQIQNAKIKVQNALITYPSFTILPHVRVNGWANGWRIDSTEYKVQSTKIQESNTKRQALGTRNSEFGSSTILLLFWPQFLQYAGFGVFIFTMLAIILKSFVSRSTRR